MAKRAKKAPNALDILSTDVAERFKDVPWQLFDSKDLASSGETRYMVSRIQNDLMQVAAEDPIRAGRIWDEHVPSFVTRPDELPPSEKASAQTNSIEPGRSRRRRTPAEAYLDQYAELPREKSMSAPELAPSKERFPSREERKTSTSPVEAKGLSNDDPQSERIKLLLSGLETQYLKAEDRYHFRDRGREVAFEAQDKKLTTQFETPAVIGSMIDLAEARGWSSLKLNGSQEFRREAWLQASLRDVEVTGYKPNTLDKVRLEELRADRGSGAVPNTMSRQEGRSLDPTGFADVPMDAAPEPRVSLTAPQTQFVAVMEATMRARGDSPEAIAKARELASDRLTSERVYVGKLVEIGSGPYQDRKGEKESHYITLDSDKGQRSKVWGVDLPRAMKASGAKPGQLVAVTFDGRKPVEIDVAVKDDAGRVVGSERQTVERNSWKIVQFDKLREDAQAAVLRKAAAPAMPPEVKVFDRTARPVARSVALKPTRPRDTERVR